MSNAQLTKRIFLSGNSTADGGLVYIGNNSGQVAINQNAKLGTDGSLQLKDLIISGSLIGLSLSIPEFATTLDAQNALSPGNIYYLTGDDTVKVIL